MLRLLLQWFCEAKNKLNQRCQHSAIISTHGSETFSISNVTAPRTQISTLVMKEILLEREGLAGDS